MELAELLCEPQATSCHGVLVHHECDRLAEKR